MKGRVLQPTFSLQCFYQSRPGHFAHRNVSFLFFIVHLVIRLLSFGFSRSVPILM